MTGPDPSSKPPTMMGFALAQFKELFYHLLMLLGGGIVRGLWRRQLHVGALMAALAVLLLAGGATSGAIFWARAQHLALPAVALWAVTLAAAMAAGSTAAWLCRRMAMWELYAATACACGAAYALLARPLTTGADQVAVYFGPTQNLGLELLGPLWDHLLLLWAPLMLMAAAVGASLTVLFCGMGPGTRSRSRELGVALEWRLAVRHLSGRRAQAISTTAIVTVLGVALGVASLIVVTAVMSGYQNDIQHKILSTNAHLVVQKYGIDFTEHAQVCQQALAVPGVAAAAPFAFNEAMLSVGGRGLGILLKGIDAKAAAGVTATARHLCLNEGDALNVDAPTCRWADDGGPALLDALLAEPADGLPAIIVGLSLYRRLGVPLGTQVHLMTPVGMAGSRGGAPKRMAFRLAGVFASGMHEFDAHLVYASLPAAQRLLGLGSSVSGVELRLDRADNVAAVGEQLMAALGHYPYRSLDWRELNASIFMALSLQKVVMFLVLAFIVVVAAFNIASTLFMAVVEKGPQIAVLLSLGATRATIMKIFVLEGWLTGLAGTALGALMGLGATFALAHLRVSIAADVYMVDALTVALAPQEVALTIGAALIICHLATLYPALRATRARPIDLLRHG